MTGIVSISSNFYGALMFVILICDLYEMQWG